MKCSECDGTGRVLDAPQNVLEGRSYWETCDRCNGTGLGPVDVSAPIADDATCQEASVLSRDTYIPCGAKAVVLIDNGDARSYLMCLSCASHNVRNRRATVVKWKDGYEVEL